MEAHKVASMFKAGGVTSKKNRQGLLRVLCHHFGKRSFDPEYKVQMLCEGHTEVSVGSIKYKYEEGAIPKVMDCTEKDISKECVAQLKVSLP